jgi:putative FmdB family regulatory protein
MPTYEYHCEKCKKDFEIFQSMKDNALATCPKEQCRQKTWGKGKVRRLLGAGAGIIFKGSGFYSTDYRSEGYKASAKSEAAASAPPKADAKAESKSTESKSESKPASPKPAPAAESPKPKKKE